MQQQNSIHNISSLQTLPKSYQQSLITKNQSLPIGINQPQNKIKIVGRTYKNQRYSQLEEIESGTSGMVYKGYDNEKKMYVTIKITNKNDQGEIQLMVSFAQQSIEQSFKHVVNVYDVIYERQEMIWIMEFANGGNLYTFMQTNPKQCEEMQKKTMLQIASGLLELHQSNYVQRDMKPENILIPSSQDDYPTFKIYQPAFKKIGTPNYMPPELIRDVENIQKHRSEVDIWALGCIYYEIITQNSLFQDIRYDNLIKKIKEVKQE